MDFFTILDIQSVVTGTILAIIGCMVKYYANKIAEYRKDMDLKEQRRIQNEQDRIDDIKKSLNEINSRIDVIAGGGILLFRDRILQTCKHDIEAKHTNFMTRENITAMYDMYHKLGGNGLVAKYYTEYMNIPVSESEEG